MLVCDGYPLEQHNPANDSGVRHRPEQPAGWFVCRGDLLHPYPDTPWDWNIGVNSKVVSRVNGQ